MPSEDYIEDNYEAKRLCDAYAAGDSAAAQRLIRAVSRYLWKQARRLGSRWRRLGLEDDDFYQIFCLKALQATRTYSPERGKWITYVSCCLRGAVSNALREYLEVVQFETQISKWSAIEAAVGDRRQRSHEVVEVSLDAEAILQRLGSRDRAALGRMFGLDGVAELRAFEEAAEAGVSASAIYLRRKELMTRVGVRVASLK